MAIFSLGKAIGYTTNTVVIISLTKSVNRPIPSMALRCRHAKLVGDTYSSYKIVDIEQRKDNLKPKGQKMHHWLKSYSDSTEVVDFASWLN